MLIIRHKCVLCKMDDFLADASYLCFISYKKVCQGRSQKCIVDISMTMLMLIETDFSTPFCLVLFVLHALLRIFAGYE